MEIQKRKVKKPKGSCLIAALSLLLAVNAHAQTVEQDLIGLGMNPELADYVSGILPGGSVLDNATFLKGRNQADSADINILKIDTGDNTVLNSSASDELVLQLEDDANRLVRFTGTSDTALAMKFGDGTASQALEISGSTADAADTQILTICGGGSCSNTRGSLLQLPGNEVSGAGDFYVATGNASGSDAIFDLKHTASVLYVRNASATPFATFDQTAGTGGLQLAAGYGLSVAQYVPTMLAGTPVAGTNDIRVGLNIVPTAAADAAAVLPASPATGAIADVINSNGTNAVNVCPGSGDTITSGGATGGANVCVGVAANEGVRFIATSASNWTARAALPVFAPTPGN